MATIKEVKKQIQNANALGIKNLKEKGVGLFSSGIITTYDIMEAISMIIVGGGGIEYIDITYNEDNTIILTDKDGVEHTMECEYTDGKLTSVKYDGKAVKLTYDGDVLVKVGKTEVDMSNAPTSIELLDHTVTFTVDSEPYEVVSVKDGNKVNEPTKPTSDSGVFAHWENENGDTIHFPYIPTSNTNLTSVFYNQIYGLYEKFNISYEEYPYIIFILVKDSASYGVYFYKNISDIYINGNSLITSNGGKYVPLYMLSFRDVSSIATVCDDILSSTECWVEDSRVLNIAIDENKYFYTNTEIPNSDVTNGHWCFIKLY